MHSLDLKKIDMELCKTLGNCATISCSMQNSSETDSLTDAYCYCLCETHNDFASESNAIEKANAVSNSNEALQYLDHFKWNLTAFVSCNESGSYQHHNVCSDSDISQKICLSNSAKSVFQDNLCQNCIACKCAEDYADNLQSGIASYLVVLFFAYGFLAVVGNSFVIANKIKYLYNKRLQNAKEKYLFNMLIVNLAVADLLMGIVSIMSFIIGWRLRFPENVIEENFCKTFVIFSFLSNQVGISVIVVISSFRLFAVIRPYKTIRFKFAITLMTTIWIFWLVFACFPLLPPFKTIFSNGLRYTHDGVGVPTDISFKSIMNLHEFLYSKTEVGLYFKSVLHVTKKFQTPEVLQKFLEILNVIDNSSENWEFIGLYKKHPRSCITVVTLIGYYEASSWYMLFVFVYIAMCSIFSTIAYVIILKRTLDQKSVRVWIKSRLCGTQTNIDKRTIREEENKKLHRTVFLIVLTDFLFWLPLSAVAVAYYIFLASESPCFYCTTNNFIYFNLLIFYMIFMPINSVINPLIYSKSICKRVCRWFTYCSKR